MKIGLLQLNPVAGDISGNAAQIRQAAWRAAKAGAALCVTSEMALTGCPPRDLLLMPAFVDKARDELARMAVALEHGPALLVGTVDRSGVSSKPLVNCAALAVNGVVGAIYPKNLLPAHGVFDEGRYFYPGSCPGLVTMRGLRIGVAIGEDAWNLEALAEEGVHAVVNLAASPFTLGAREERERLLADAAKKYGIPILCCNQTGGNDDLVFDGRSAVMDAKGRLVARAKGFEPDILVVDVNHLAQGAGPQKPQIAEDDFSEECEAWRALTLGVRDYAAKCGFTGALPGLSGGVDSALTAAIAAEALGPENVLGVLMPSPYSSRGSVDHSLELAGLLGIKTRTIVIDAIMAAFGQALAPAFAGKAPDVTEENIQSRIRGSLLMALSNKFGTLLLSTGNKSELAVGYCTIYGDMAGGLAVLSDVPKTLVYRLAEYANVRGPMRIPRTVIDKAPSAELRPNQLDADSLPPYEELDAILKLRLERRESVAQIAARGFDAKMVKRVCKLVKNAEFKRRQAAPGIKITDMAFGALWRMPVACRFDV